MTNQYIESICYEANKEGTEGETAPRENAQKVKDFGIASMVTNADGVYIIFISRCNSSAISELKGEKSVPKTAHQIGVE